MRIGDLIEKISPEVLCLSGEETIDGAVRQMARAGATAILVLEGERPVGIFSRGDLVRCWQKDPGFDPLQTLLKQAMTPRLITTGPEQDLRDAVALMRQTGIGHLPIFEEGRPIGLLALSSAMSVQMDSLEKELRHLSEYLADLHDAEID